LVVIALAFLWHQHQPYYPDDVAGENLMPWVRLHGVKDYYGMARHLLEFPEMACTINLVPSLLLQLQAYCDGTATDKPFQVARQPADGLNEDDVLYLLETSFMASAEQMIKPLPRFHELFRRRGSGPVREVVRRFSTRDFRDLQVLFNLAWIHPLAFEDDESLRELRKKGRNFTEAEKNLLLDRQLDLLRKVVPLHRQLLERGQVELSTTPFYHPILPLLLDKKLAQEAVPDAKLPRYTGGYPEDAAWQLRRAVERHTELFGQAPQGLWPAEGGVCQSMIPLVAQHGFRWIATDEEVLGHSTQGFVSRDTQGHVRNPHQMYRPYRVREGGSELAIVFRDHLLSDRIGFHYQRSDPVQAADDFLRHLHNIDRATEGPEPTLVTIILDGENCWEHYPGGGAAFLRALYERCTKSKQIRPVRLGPYLQECPPRDALPRLSAGSWIRHNFAIWIGHEEDNNAWNALHETREHLRERTTQGHVSENQARRAWEEVYIAEGSDWFWWYGDDHSSVQDEVFDYLFRKHLQNVYQLLGENAPAQLFQPIKRRASRSVYTLPRSFLDVKIDGRHTFFEWLGAGRYVARNERGSMAMITPGPLKEVHFGFDLEHLLLRIDFAMPARQVLADFDRVRIAFAAPAGVEVLLQRPADMAGAAEVTRLQAQLLGHDVSQPNAAALQVGIDRIIEVAIPFAALNVQARQPVQFFVELLEGSQSRDRAPKEATINLLCPSADFEQIMWQV
jgi:alpha-amylase/alpha-mannosidase (GH57 family)